MKKIIFIYICLLFALNFGINNSYASEGDVWLVPNNISNMTPSKTFDVELHADTGGKNIGAFNMFLDFDSNHITVDTSQGNDGISVGGNTQNYMILANPNDLQNGHYRFAGISATSLANGNDVTLAIIHLKSTQTFTAGETDLHLRINELADELGNALSAGSITGTKITSENELTPIYRLFNKRTGVHLYTRGEADRDKILAKWSDFEFTDNAPAFYASLIDDGTTPIYRLFNKRTGVHLYTRGEADRNKILAKWSDFEFTDNAPAFYASLVQKSGLTPIYRLFNKRTGVHLYTRGEADRDKILAKWSDFEFTDNAPAFWMKVE